MERVGFVYVLHLKEKLAHSQHYVGCTANLEQRLITHAQGKGARIIEAALDEGIGFRLGAVGLTNIRCMRRLERQCKNWKHASEFCEICRGDLARAIPGTRPYCMEHINFPMDSDELALRNAWLPRREIRFTTVADADGGALAIAIKKLMQPDKDALGFIPVGGKEGLGATMRRGKIVIAMHGEEVVGYCAFTENEAMVRIHQCCVADAVRGCGIGRDMVRLVIDSRPGRPVQAKVRIDLPANEFWQAIGFVGEGFETHETSGCQLNIYRYYGEQAGKAAVAA